MAEDFRMAGAYVEVNLKDNTVADEAKLRQRLESAKPIEFGTALKDPWNADLVRQKLEALKPIELGTELKDPWNAELFRQKVESSRPIELGTTLKDPDNTELIRKLIEDGPPVKIPTEVDPNQAQKAFKSLTDTIDSSTAKSGASIKAFLGSTVVQYTALGALLSGPAVGGSLAVLAGGFALVGVAAEHSSPQVVSAFNTMKTTGVDVLQNGFTSLTPVIVSSLNSFTVGIRQLSPEFSQISGELAPAFGIVSTAIVKAALTDMPAFTRAMGNATPMAQTLAGGVGEVSTGFAKFLDSLDFTAADAGLAFLMRDVGQLLPVLGGLLNAVMPVGNALLGSVVPAVIKTAGELTGDLAPALHLIGSTVQALAPVLNFMSGPTASVLVGVLAFKALSATTNTLLPIFNTVSTGATGLANKVMSMAGASGQSVGSFTLLTDAAKKQAVQAAATALASAQLTSTQAKEALTNLESAAAADAASVSEKQLAVGRIAATAATEAEAEATTALAAASEASSFAFGPVGIGLAAVAGLMTLFTSNTTAAAPPVQDFTSQLEKLATAAPSAVQGILASDPALADLTNKLNAAGISVKDMGAAQAGGAANQRAFQSQVDSATKAVGDQQVTIEGNTAASEALGYGSQSTTKSIAELADAVAHGDLQIGYLTDSQQQAVTHFQAMQTGSKTVADQFSKNASAAQAAAGVNAQATQLTADQQAAAAVMAKQYGLSVDAVAAAFATLPGAGSAADGAVGQVTSAFNNGEIALKNAQQATSDYFSSLQTNAAQANNAVVNANHSYQQSVASVADAEHGAAQAADGVVTARRAVTDATNSAAQSELSYEASQRAVEDAESGVTAAERTLAQAQVSETQAQKTLTDARQAAVEQLKSMQLQLADQVASEQAAEIKLFDAKNTAGGQNINTGNVDSILAAPLTASNEAQKKAALDLKDAVNALADSLDQGAQLREKVTAANQAGVAGNPAVVSATQALASAQSQVNAASVGVTKAHQAVADAVNAEQQALYNLGKAQQAIADAQKGVSTAVYNEQKARSAVKDAIFAERQALLSLNDAQAAAKKANDLNTTSLDLNTQAGRNNWAQLQTNFAAIPAWVIGNARYKQMVDDTAIAFGGSKQAAADFLKAQGAIPHTFDYSVNAVASVNTAALDGYFKGAIRSPGGRLMMAGGGHVRGPGGPTSDDVNAKLSDNEFVEPSHVVDHYGVPFFEALRQKKIPKPVGGDGASLPGFASGGLFDSNAVGAVAGADFESYRNALGFLGFPQPPQMPAYAPDAGGNLNFTGTPGVNQWAPQVLQVLGMLGQPASLLPNVLRRMNQESSGNPTIVNTWDSNAKAGHPSVGLMQVIRGTFRSNAGPYVNTGPFIDGVSVDPVANIYAGLEHAINSYPSLQYAMDKPGGYDSGGYMLNKPALNSSGKPEMVLPPGMTNTMERLNTAMQSGGGSTPNGAGDVTHNWNITINGADMPDEQLASAVTSEVTWRLGAMS